MSTTTATAAQCFVAPEMMPLDTSPVGQEARSLVMLDGKDNTVLNVSNLEFCLLFRRFNLKSAMTLFYVGRVVLSLESRL